MPNTLKDKDDVLKIVDGTTESSANVYLGKQRRELTGVLDTESRAKNLSGLSKGAKILSILFSGMGFAITVLLISDEALFSVTSWIAFIVGLTIGYGFEKVSTSMEYAFVKNDLDDTDPNRTLSKIFLATVKMYAVSMHIVTIVNLPTFIDSQMAHTVKDNSYITSRIAQIERLTKDKDNSKDSSALTTIYQNKINRLNNEIVKIRAEKTEALVLNSTSKFVNKRKDALKTLKSINDRVEEKNKEIATAEQNMVNSANGKTKKQLYEDEITAKEDEITKEREKLKKESLKGRKISFWVYFIIAVLLFGTEITGTFTSIMRRRLVLSSMSSEESYKENITNTLFSSRVALKERNTRLKAVKISSDLEQNKVMTKVIEYESKANAQNHELTERARLAEIDRENAKLLTETKMQELEANQMLALADGVVKKLEGLDTVHERINKMLRKR